MSDPRQPGASPGRFAVIDEPAAPPGEVAAPAPAAAEAPPVRPVATVIETEDDTPITPALEPITAPPLPEIRASLRPPRLGVWVVGSLAALLVVYWLVSLGEWLADQFGRHLLIGLAVVPFALAALGLLARWIWGEVAAWRRLVIVDELRPDLCDTRRDETDRFLRAVRRLEATMEEPARSAIATFLHQAQGNRGADELRILLDHEVVHPMDDRAVAVIHRAVYDSFFLGMISPTPATDTAAFVFRAIGMIRGVAGVYGHRPGHFGLYRLVRRMLVNVAVISTVMIVMGRAAPAIGRVLRGGLPVAGALAGPLGVAVGGTLGEVAGDISDAAGQELADAATAAAQMGQLGLLAITVSRPLLLTDERRKQLTARLRGLIFSFRRRPRTAEAEAARVPASPAATAGRAEP